MKFLSLLIFTFTLSGCVIYPSKHVTEPRYEVSIDGDKFNHVYLTSEFDAPKGVCANGEALEKVATGTYSSEAKYGWIKTMFMVPVDLYVTIQICAVDSNNQEYFWKENIGVFGNAYPEVWRFKCIVTNMVLECEKYSKS